MARKELGHIELQWRCPNCENLNLGRERTCSACGAPQPEGVQFEQAAQQKIIEDEVLETQAKAGADIHCAYCGTRNPAGTKACSQCGSDISEGIKREAGRVIGAFQTGPAQPVACSACGAENAASARQCVQCGAPIRAAATDSSAAAGETEVPAQQNAKKLPIVLIIVAVLVCIGMIAVAVLSMKTSSISGTVQQIQWERSVALEAFGPVDHSDWQDAIPADVENVSCTEKYRYTSSTPAENSKEVCGTPYTVDSGGGFAEVVQDCEYQVYDEYCSYTVIEWSYADTIVANGSGLNAEWPAPNLSSDQRLGDPRSETYSVVFQTDKDVYTYNPEDFTEYQRYQPGSVWNLDVNTFGVVVSVQP